MGVSKNLWAVGAKSPRYACVSSKREGRSRGDVREGKLRGMHFHGCKKLVVSQSLALALVCSNSGTRSHHLIIPMEPFKWKTPLCIMIRNVCAGKLMDL